MRSAKSKKIPSIPELLIGLGILSSAILAAQAVRSPESISSPRPLADEARRVQRLFGKVVTYEDPLWRWSGDSEPKGQGFLLKYLSFVRPADSGDDPQLILNRTLDEYHRQTNGPRFAVLTSRWGLHIVPTQVHDENGQLVEAVNPLDARITVPVEARTATQHFVAVLSQVSLAAGIGMEFSPDTVTLTPGFDPFEAHFGADPIRFPWGTSGTVARDAIVDLLDRSATTYSWSLGCEPGHSTKCYFSLGEIQITVTGTNGRPMNKMVLYDRCGACDRLKNRPEEHYSPVIVP
jgi:hypothetical protein